MKFFARINIYFESKFWNTEEFKVKEKNIIWSARNSVVKKGPFVSPTLKKLFIVQKARTK